MKRILLSTLFVVAGCLLMSPEARAQNVYATSSASYNAATNTVTGYAQTQPDYNVQVYYNQAFVTSGIQDASGKQLASKQQQSYQTVSISFQATGDGSASYSIGSGHAVWITYYNTNAYCACINAYASGYNDYYDFEVMGDNGNPNEYATFDFLGTGPDCFYDTPEIILGGTSALIGPTITLLSPNKGVVGSSLGVTVAGGPFTPSSTVQVTGYGVSVSDVTFANGQLLCTFSITPDASAGNHSVTVTTGALTSSPVMFYVQVPSSLKLLSQTVYQAALRNGCSLSQPYGMLATLKYQVLDQAGNVIYSTMPIRENLTNAKANGQYAGPDKLNVNVTSSGFTNSDGTFVDQPVGAASGGAFQIAPTPSNCSPRYQTT